MKEARRLFSVLTLAGLLLAGCASRPQARFVDGNRTYTLDQVSERAASLRSDASASVRVEDAAEVRQRVLAELRKHGALASQAADLMTRQFPPVTNAVPFYVEAATVEGRPCWVIVESWGGRTGTLTFRRLWVFDRATADLLASRTYR